MTINEVSKLKAAVVTHAINDPGSTEFHRKLSEYSNAVRQLAFDDAFRALSAESMHRSWMVER